MINFNENYSSLSSLSTKLGYNHFIVYINGITDFFYDLRFLFLSFYFQILLPLG